MAFAPVSGVFLARALVSMSEEKSSGPERRVGSDSRAEERERERERKSFRNGHSFFRLLLLLLGNLNKHLSTDRVFESFLRQPQLFVKTCLILLNESLLVA